MKRKVKIIQILILLITLNIIHFSNIIIYPETLKNDTHREFERKILRNNLKIAGDWVLNGIPIFIDDANPNYNWSKTAAENDWCYGLGTWNNPYIIENVTIDGDYNGNCITIRNSVKYFIIRNCTIFNSGSGEENAGIYLYKTHNGIIYRNNIFSNSDGLNFYGIYCINNSVIENNIELNTRNGIHTYSYFQENFILNNSIINNGQSGIYFESWDCIGNVINNNEITHNSNGIYLEAWSNELNFNQISYNNISYNSQRGIYCANPSVNISYNLIHNNLYYGIHLRGSGDIVFNNTIHHNYDRGIFLDRHADNNVIENNYIFNNTSDEDYVQHNCGIYLYRDCTNNDIIGNIISKQRTGIHTYYQCHNNNYSNNEISNCTFGITESANQRSTFIGNKMVGCGISFYPGSGINELVTTNFDNSNTVNGKPLFFYKNRNNLQPLDFINAGQVILVNCTNSTIANLKLSRGTSGIELYDCSNITVFNNLIYQHTILGVYLHRSNYNNIINNTIVGVKGEYYARNHIGGISLRFSDNNNISKNTLYNNAFNGISIDGVNNLVFLNKFIGNLRNAFTTISNNHWDNGTIGNYWGGYNGKDIDDDGIGDTPYNIPEAGIDNFPIWWDPPLLSISYLSNWQILGKTAPNFILSVDEGIADSIWYSLDDGATNYSCLQSDSIDQSLWDSFGNGTVPIRFYINDSKGFFSFIEITLRKDIIDPIIYILEPTNHQEFTENPPSFSISIDEVNIEEIWYTIDNGARNYSISAFTGVIDQTSWKAAPSGNVIIRFYVRDSAGNVGTSQVIVIKKEMPLLEQPDQPGIPGYNITIFLCLAVVLTIIIVRRRIYKQKKGKSTSIF